MVPFTVPVAVGVKVTVMVQFAPAAKEAQLLVCAKFALALTLSASVLVPPLLTVKVLVALVVLTTTFPNEREVGLMLIGPTPVP
jgi:hypothetical protein